MTGTSAIARMSFQLEAIGYVRGGRTIAEDDDWGAIRAQIALDNDQFSSDALMGLESFSHAEVVYLFDRVGATAIQHAARRPRNNPGWPLVGIFAQRGKNRPNRLGVSICTIVGVRGTNLEVEGLDALDGTPVLDIKPVISGFLPRGPLREPDWSREIMRSYW